LVFDEQTMPRAFSLIELVIVIVIIGIIAAIAIPRVSRGASNAGEAALKADLRVLRNAIEQCRAHRADGSYPGTSVALEILLFTHAIPILPVPMTSGGRPRATINPFGASVRNYAEVGTPGLEQDSWMYCDENGDLWVNEPTYGSW
jgi:prepilin-type N-terminal cleavage/methylation domain-containing protein